MNKKDKLLEIIEQIQELYPQLDRLMITDMDDPQSIIITTKENLESMAEDYGLDPDMIDGLMEDDLEDSVDEFMNKLEWDGEDDDNGGGMMQ